jgi:hypothetical protein
VKLISGQPRLFISQAIRDGRNMCKKGIHKDVVLLDVNSLYPRALGLINIPLGEPLMIRPDTDYCSKPYFIIEINITQFKHSLYYHKMKSGLISVDKTELDDLVGECEIKYEIVKGYYWGSYLNPRHTI